MPDWLSAIPWSARLCIGLLAGALVATAITVRRIEKRLEALHSAFLKKFYDID